MYSCKILFKILTILFTIVLCIDVRAQVTLEAPAKIDFAGVSLQLTGQARQSLQQSLNTLYIDRTQLTKQLETLNQLRPLLDSRLSAKGIPLDFRYVCLPFTDPTYDPNAYWGLTRLQAEQLQLPVNQLVDCRRHVLLATEAALPYFGQLYQQNQHWIKTLFQHFDTSSPANLPPDENRATSWVLNQQTPAAVWMVLARKIAFEHEQTLRQQSPALVVVDYPESNGKTLSDVAQQLKISPDVLLPYNNWLLTDRVPTTGNFPVILRLRPEEYLAIKPSLFPKAIRPVAPQQELTDDLGFPVLQRLDSKKAYPSAIFYQINDRRGIQAQLCDNAITLSYYGKLSIPKFLKINDLPAQANLKPGEIYYLQRKAKRAKIPYHVVRQNQTLQDISTLYGVRLKSLVRYNRLKNGQRVQPGRLVWMRHKRPARYPVEYQWAPQAEPKPSDQIVLDTTRTVTVADSVSEDSSKIEPLALPPVNEPQVVSTPEPAQDEVTTPPAVTKIHIVKPGQTYFSIAKLYGITVNQLCAWNSVSVNDPLQVGQELIIASLGPTALRPRRKQQLVSASKSPIVKTTPLPATSTQKVYYTVKPGETAYRIALNHGISVVDLMRWNGLSNFTIHVGQRLLVSRPPN